jgi:N-methylhydantoinase A/oxoprolinase/acetone carboxylase beta subunit
VSLAQQSAYRLFLAERVERLVVHQVALRAGFTPTDALHVLGRFRMWNTEAAILGAELLAAQVGLSVEAFCCQVVDLMSDRVAAELVTKVLHDEIAPPDWDEEPVAAGLMSRAFNQVADTDLLCQFTLRQPIVAVGAPVAAYLPRSAEQLHTELIIPAQAGVTNAIGAVAGSVVQRARVLIRPIDFGERFRLHAPGNLLANTAIVDFETVDDAVAYAQESIPAQIKRLACEAGAEQVEVQVARIDHTGAIQEVFDQAVFLETELLFTAAGRPAMTGDDIHA